MSERTVEDTGHQLAAFRPGVFNADIKVTETDAFVVSLNLYRSGSDTVVIFKLQSSAADTDTVKTFILMFILIADFQGCILLSVLKLTLDIGRNFKFT